MVTIPTHKQLAKGLKKALNSKEMRTLTNKLIDRGKTAAVTSACAIGRQKLGLPEEVCHRVAEHLITDVSKEIRKKLRN